MIPLFSIFVPFFEDFFFVFPDFQGTPGSKIQRSLLSWNGQAFSKKAPCSR